jgi:hypothetical protein
LRELSKRYEKKQLSQTYEMLNFHETKPHLTPFIPITLLFIRMEKFDDMNFRKILQEKLLPYSIPQNLNIIS